MTVTQLRKAATSEQKFGSLLGPLYPVLNVENGVRTPGGIGTLRQAFSKRCLVSLMREKPVTHGKYTYTPMREFPTKQVEVVR